MVLDDVGVHDLAHSDLCRSPVQKLINPQDVGQGLLVAPVAVKSEVLAEGPIETMSPFHP
jgi:hypothetical protein